ncbi:MAG: hypothetical protein R2756_08845 [Bacteroidales bacterium]
MNPKPVLIRRLFISEGTSPASVTFRRPMKPGTTDTHQQAEITVSTGSLPVTDPYKAGDPDDNAERPA